MPQGRKSSMHAHAQWRSGHGKGKGGAWEGEGRGSLGREAWVVPLGFLRGAGWGVGAERFEPGTGMMCAFLILGAASPGEVVGETRQPGPER